MQLIDGSELYQKLRKNLGAKNCEFAPEHIEKITHLYLEMQPPSPSTDSGRRPAGEGSKAISKVFDNSDFGYYKVTVERPLRLAAQFKDERLAVLRFVSALRSPMEWSYQKWGDAVYTELADHGAAISAYLEQEEIEPNKKQQDALFSLKTWEA